MKTHFLKTTSTIVSRSLFCKQRLITSCLHLKEQTNQYPLRRHYSDKNENKSGASGNKTDEEKLSDGEKNKEELEASEKEYNEAYAKYMKHSPFKDSADLPPEFVDESSKDSLFHLKRAAGYCKSEAKKTWQFLKDPTGYYQGDGLFPSHVDILIIGGGAIGSSVAYFIKEKVLSGCRVAVVDRDFTVNYDLPEYARASTTLSVGGLRQQFSLRENIEMSLFGAEFLRNIKHNCYVQGEDEPDVNFTPNGYLFCASEAGADTLTKNHELQKSLGAVNVLLSPNKLKEKFPWLNTEGIALGCLGLEKEGWFDPWLYLSAVKKKAISLGAEYVKGEVVNFIRKHQPGVFADGYDEGEYKGVNEAVVRDEKGELRTITFAICVVAAGAYSGEVAKLLKIGDRTSDQGYLFVPLPVEPRKRYVYCLECPQGPGVNTPMVIDPTGTYFRREGLGNYYICGKSPSEGEPEPLVDNLEVDYEYFNQSIWPLLADRVKAFEELKVVNAWAGYYDYNYFDENAIIGTHPGYFNVYFATGFSGHGIQQAPAIGRAMAELIIDSQFKTIDLSRFMFDRVIKQQQMREVNIV